MCVYKPRAPSKEARLADQRFQERPRIGSQAERCACAFNRQELGAAYGNIEFKDVLSQVLEPDSRLAMVDEVDRAGDAYIKAPTPPSLCLLARPTTFSARARSSSIGKDAMGKG